jgi:hypothetical protein
MSTLKGKIEVQDDTSSQTRITLNGNDASLSSGGKGTNGKLIFYDIDGKERLRIGAEVLLSIQDRSMKKVMEISDAEVTGLWIGSDKTSDGRKAGVMALRDNMGNDTIFLDGAKSLFEIKGPSEYKSIILDGNSGSIFAGTKGIEGFLGIYGSNGKERAKIDSRLEVEDGISFLKSAIWIMDTDGYEVMELESRGKFSAGGNNHHGSVSLKDASGSTVLSLMSNYRYWLPRFGLRDYCALLLGNIEKPGIIMMKTWYGLYSIVIDAQNSSVAIGEMGGSIKLEGNTASINLKDSIKLEGNTASINLKDSIKLEGNTASINLKDSIKLEGNTASINLKDSIKLEGHNGNIILGKPGGKSSISLYGVNGDLTSYDQYGNHSFSLHGEVDGYTGVWLGGSGGEEGNKPGKMFLRNDRGNDSITLDGLSGDILLNNADCAEDFDIAEKDEIEPGTVVIIEEEDKLQQSSKAYDKRVAGVVSGAGYCKPGIILDKKKSKNKRVPVALVGKVYCKVDADYSEIRVGDMLTTSKTDGHAMKVQDPLKAFGAVIGKALRPLKTGKGLIPILVALQ